MARTVICAGPCGQPIVVARGSLPEGEATCSDCRRVLGLPLRGRLTTSRRDPNAYKKTISCTTCGAPMWFREGNVAAVPCCRSCRRTLTAAERAALGIVRTDAGYARARRMKQCEQCGEEFRPPKKVSRFCSSACYGKWNSGRAVERSRARTSPDLPKLRRADRARLAPGLTSSQRKRLMKKWRRQGRACAFCDSVATTIDHVVPLARGGTNYEGNLVPCCKSCNSSKSDLLVIEWVAKRGHGGTVDRRPWLTDATVTRNKAFKELSRAAA